MVAFDLVTGILIFIVALAAETCTRRYRFMALFAVCPYLRHVLQLIGHSKYSKTLIFVRSPGIFMNLGGSFSLEVSRSGVEEMFLVVIQVAFFTSRRLYSFFSSMPYFSISGML